MGDEFKIDFDEILASFGLRDDDDEGTFSDYFVPDNILFDACGNACGEHPGSHAETDTALESAFDGEAANVCILGEAAADDVDSYEFFDNSPCLSPTWQNLSPPFSSAHSLANFADCTSYSPLSTYPQPYPAPAPASFSHWTPPEVACNFPESPPLDSSRDLPTCYTGSSPQTGGQDRIGSLHINVPYPARLPQRNSLSSSGFHGLGRSQTGFPANRAHLSYTDRLPAPTRLQDGWGGGGGRQNPYEYGERSPRVQGGKGGGEVEGRVSGGRVEREWLQKFHLHAPVTTPRGRQAKLCDNCILNRQIIHSNGVQDTRLELHWEASTGGGLPSTTGCGGSCHAVLHTRSSGDTGREQALQQQIIKIPGGDVEFVHSFLAQYTMLREKEGFVCCYDSSPPPQPDGEGGAVGQEWDTFMGAATEERDRKVRKVHKVRTFTDSFHGERRDGNSGYGQGPSPSSYPWNPKASSAERTGGRKNSSESDLIDGMLPHPHPHPHLQLLPSSSHLPPSERGAPTKSTAAAQRERTGKLKVADLAVHFHLPINLAAKELGICPTVLKKICRRNNMRRWPHRKIKSIERIITTLEQTLAEGVTSGEATICKEIAQLQQEKDLLCAGILGDL